MAGLTYLEPMLPVLMLLLAAGVLAGWRGYTKAGLWLITVAAAGLWFWSWPPASRVFAGALEWRYPQQRLPSHNIQAIVVLSSNLYAPNPPRPFTLPGFRTYLRCQCAAWLYRKGWTVPVVVSGGRLGGRVFAHIMRDELLKEGIPKDQILIEDKSNSTYDNARRSADLLRPRGIRRIALVTEAYHMPRAETSFRRQGFLVEPAPCAFRSDLAFDAPDWLPNSAAVELNDAILHEWVGILWYSLRGR